MDKAEKKRRLKQWSAEQRAKARALMPMTFPLFKALFDWLDDSLPEVGCDHSHRLTADWLQRHSKNTGAVLDWLRESGGFCDCEVLANCEEAVDGLREPRQGRPQP